MITIAAHKKGDWWRGMTLTFPFSITGYTFKADFKVKPLGNTVFSFTTADNSITINTSLNKITFVAKIIDQVASRYISDLEMIPPNGQKETITDISWEITQDRTS